MRVDVGGSLHLNYVEEGQGIPFLMVAGPGFDFTHARQSDLHLFSTHLRTILYDTRGGGESDWSDWYSYRSSAEDAAGLLKALGIDKAIVYGGSNGGILAQHFALNFPGMVRALVLDGTSSEVNAMAARNWRNLALRTLQENRDVMKEASGPAAFPGNEFKLRGPRVPRDKEPDPRAMFAMLNGIADLYDYPLTPRLKEITCTTLILIGEQDKLVGAGGSVKMHRAIPGSRLRILSDSGHTVLNTTPEVAKKEILELVNAM